MKRMMTFLVCLTLLLSLTPRAQALSLDKPCSLRVRLEDETETVIGGTLTLRRVAGVTAPDGKLQYALTAAFAPSGADLGDVNDPSLPKILAAFAEENHLPGETAAPGDGGVTAFPGLSAGMYLVTQESAPEGYYPIDPFLVCLPATSADGAGWVYDLEASPKLEPLPEVPTERVDLTVKKVWDDSGKNRPGSVKIGLFADGEEIDRVNLSRQNGWKHTWRDLDGGREYEVRELDVPRGYTATYRIRNGVVTVTNTATLIQTGQLNWPVPVMAVSGLVLLMIGMILLRDRRRP